jgi:hypothetical protein
MGLMDPGAMHPLKLERDVVEASGVFYDKDAWEDLLAYSMRSRQYEKYGCMPESISAINHMKVQDGYVPEEISHQELTGRRLIRQAALIREAPFFKAIRSHPENRTVSGFHRQKRLIKETIQVLNLLRRTGNAFRKNKIQTVLGTPAEVSVAWQCFAAIWPAGIDLYGILRELYPAFHGRLTGQIPDHVARNMERLLERDIDRKSIKGIGRVTVDDGGRFLGLYPVAEVPEECVTLESTFISQDQAGRKALVRRVLDDIAEMLNRSPDGPVIVLDYAGGVGNLSELLLKMIYSLDDKDLRTRLKDRVGVVVIDMAEDQLAAGIRRFEALGGNPDLKGIDGRITFVKGDVTRPLSESLLRTIHDRFGMAFNRKPVYLGMTAYTLGALDIQSEYDVVTYAQAMAREAFKQCSRIYAVDFSSPMWRMNGFLRDTRRWGKEYLRTIHGVPDPRDESTLLPMMISSWLSIRYGMKCRTVAELVRSMAFAPALASHYITAWPGSVGHNAGYSIDDSGNMKKPGIITFADALMSCGADVSYRSKVWLVGTLDLGRTSKGNRAWAFIPGWVADFMVAQNSRRL